MSDNLDSRSGSLSRGIPEKGSRVWSIVESQSLALLPVSLRLSSMSPDAVQSSVNPCSRQGEAGKPHDGAVVRVLPKRNETWTSTSNSGLVLLSFAPFLSSARIWRSHASKSSENERMRHQVEKRSDLSRSVTQSLSEPCEPGLYCLPPFDLKPYKFADLFRSPLSSNDKRKTILELSGETRRFSSESSTGCVPLEHSLESAR